MSLPLFLLTVAGISLSGVMMPGPVFAATVARSWRSKFTGSFVALGHGIVEIPLMFLIYFGFSNFFQNFWVKVVLGFVGGTVLIYMGRGIFNLKKMRINSVNDPPTGSTVVGIVTSLFNPYFIVWWATVGAALIVKSASFGLLGFALFIPVHWLCDFGWYSFLSCLAHKSSKVWGQKIQIALLSISSLLLIGFGVWFILSSLKWIS